MKEIEILLKETVEIDSENKLTVENIKNWLSEYLEMREEDLIDFPNERSKNHWDLLVADYDPNRNAMFLLAYFSGDIVRFLGGIGATTKVKSFAENEFPENPDEIVKEVEGRFIVKHRVDLKQIVLNKWLKS